MKPFPFPLFLRCPRCGSPFTAVLGALRCDRGHAFDIAREGYVHLALRSRLVANADTAPMVEARLKFLSAGHFDPLTRALAQHAAEILRDQDPARCVLDAGAGPGHYLAQVLDRVPDRLGLALDLSKFAARRAARAHPRIGAVVADLTQPLPVMDGVAGLGLSVFAPRPAQELWRVLGPGGALVAVTPGPRHLGELIDRIGLLTVDTRKESRLRERMKDLFELRAVDTIEHPIEVSRTEASALIGMGPNAFHLGPEEVERRLQALPDRMELLASFRLHVFMRVAR
ncbi:MAG: hypothetical protein IRZ16_22185 [Myxococcaceae bacterium]|nr:hypothetical protein [Myxococcaceae bacterium]